jgi:nucleoid-associated protein YgaU
VALLIAATLLLSLYREPDRTVQQQAALQSLPTSPAQAPVPPAAQDAPPPSFDIVSVDQHGQAVIAGRALPGDRVRVLDGETPIGEVSADSRGEWVLVPEAPIAPGNRQLGVEAIAPGGAVRRSPDVVALSVVPHKAQGGRSALAVLLPGEPGMPARILQRPEEPARSGVLSLDTAEYGGADRLVLSGNAEPGARLNIYAGGRLLGSATADEAGKWVLRSASRTPAAAVELRLDQLAADGSIVRRVAVPLRPPDGTAIRDGETYVVERGNSLWLIARRAYGRGTRYTAIYEANQPAIGDPDRLYPGQELRLPPP